MKILYAGYVQGIDNAAQYYFFPQRLINGFTRLGHTVCIFNDRDTARYSNILRSSSLGSKSMNKSFIECCREYQPELIVLGHCEKITNETIAEIYKILPEVKIIYTNVDPLNSEKTRHAILNRSKIVDAVFSTTAGDALKEFSGHKAFIAFWPNLVDISIDTGQAFSRDNDIDLFFAGSSLGKEDCRYHFINELVPMIQGNVNFKLFGCQINDETVKGSEYINYLSSSNMGVILNKTEDYYLYSSDRMAHYMANGMMVLCPDTPRYDDIFNDHEIVIYKDVEDLADKLKYFTKNSDERQSIAKKGYEKMHEFFDCQIVGQYLLDMVSQPKLKNENSYIWPTTKY